MNFYKVSEQRARMLLEAEEILETLEACGVDNWDGYGEALKNYNFDFSKAIKSLSK